MQKKTRYLTVSQVADYLEVSKQAINSWINAGKLKVYRLPSGRIKILRSDFLSYLETNNLYIEKDFFGIAPPQIVVIDDDEKVIDIYKMFFQEMDSSLAVEYANDGITGLLKIGTSKATIVLLDIEMPKMNGIEVCKKILADSSLSGIIIIIVTGYLSKYRDELDELGITAIIEKPFKPSDLWKVLFPIINKNE